MIAIPTLVMGLLCLFYGRGRRRWIPFGLLLSAAGDAAGAMGFFGLQMGAFALALGCYTADFLPYGRFRGVRIGGFVTAFVGFFTFLGILVERIYSPIEAVAVGLYAMLLFVMLSATLLQHRKHWRWYLVAALLFILSDSLIGFSRYSEGLSVADGWILLPYYAAQAIFTGCYLADER